MTQHDINHARLVRNLLRQVNRLTDQVAGLFQRGKINLAEFALATTAAVIVTNEHGKIAHVSPGFTELTGFARQDVLGQTPAMALHGQHTDHKTVEMLRARCKAGEPFGVNILLYAKDNHPIWVSSHGRPIVRGGRLLGYVITESAIGKKAVENAVQSTPKAARATAA